MTAAAGERLVTIGRIAGVFGVKGWVKVYSETADPASIFDYTPWCLTGADGVQRTLVLESARPHGKGLVAKLEGIDERDAAAALVGSEIRVPRSHLPPARDGEVYWCDLEGAEVVGVDGFAFGRISHLFSTGANDVIVVRGGEREHLIPFARPTVVREIDLAQARVVVDWDPEF